MTRTTAFPFRSSARALDKPAKSAPMAANMLRESRPIIGRGIEIFFGWQGQNARRRGQQIPLLASIWTKAVRGPT